MVRIQLAPRNGGFQESLFSEDIAQLGIWYLRLVDLCHPSLEEFREEGYHRNFQALLNSL